MTSSRSSSSFLLFLALNILLVTFISACGECPSTPLPKPKPKPTPKPSPKAPTTPTPKPPTPATPSPGQAKCPKDVLKLGVCANVLGLVNVIIGSSSEECCSLLSGLADLDAAVCLCTALKANILGINLDIPISLTVLLNVCDRKKPENFSCA